MPKSKPARRRFVAFKPDAYIEEQVAQLFEEVLDLVVIPCRDDRAGETFVECRLCGQWEDHTDTCPIPLIEKWMKEEA